MYKVKIEWHDDRRSPVEFQCTDIPYQLEGWWYFLYNDNEKETIAGSLIASVRVSYIDAD